LNSTLIPHTLAHIYLMPFNYFISRILTVFRGQYYAKI
jgi:hypothetical protein